MIQHRVQPGAAGRIAVGAGAAALALGFASPATAQDAAGAAAVRFDVRAIQVIDNTLLPAREVEAVVYPFMGPGKTPDDIENARAALQKAYEQRGYVTVSVYIPEQNVDGGIIKLQVQAQVIGKVAAPGSSNPARIVARAPSVTPGKVPDFTAFQKDVIALNSRPDLKVTPDVRPGEEPNTIDVDLKVEESSPFHGSLEINNQQSAATTDLRVSAALRYDNLWGRGDSISVSAQTAPRRIEDGSVFSVNYAAGIGRAQAIAYYVHSESDLAVIGGLNVIGRGNLGGLRLIVPVGQSEGFYQSVTAGFDYKSFKEDVRLGADRSQAPIRYAPVTLGWRGDVTGEGRGGFLSLSATLGVRGIGDDEATFDFKRYKARPNFFYLRGEAESRLRFWGEAELFVRGTGQYADAPLISNEQFALGGADTVRGYFESEALGDYGLAGQVEVRSPPLAVGAWEQVRFHAFFDGGFAGIHDPLIGQASRYRFLSVGGGARVKLLTYLNGAVDVGVPLRTGPDSDSGQIFGRFRFWGEF